MKNEIICSLCGRTVTDVSYREKHHLIPRSKGGKETEVMCIDCGNQVHELFSNNELRDSYSTIEALKSDDRIVTWVRWIRRQKGFGICMKKKKRKK